MKFIRKEILLIAIVIIASALRLYKIGEVPGSLNWDEVSLGYNAYSILQTGRDEYSELLPIVLRSYDDYKPALYTYFTIPYVMLFGLTEQAVRLPSATAGIIAVLLVYFLVLELLQKSKISIFSHNIDSKNIALLSSLLLAISPWHIQFSRIAFESNVGLTINILAFLLFLKGLKRHYLLPISFFVAGANINIYQSERVFSPLLIIALSIIFYNKLLKIKKWVVFSVFAALLAALPFILYISSNSNALMRAKGVSVFSQQSSVERSAVKLLYDESTHYVLGKVLDNRRTDFVKATVAGYISHFDLNWLFITGDIARHHAPNMGLLYIFELPFLLIGIYIFAFLSIDKKYKIAFFTYFLLVPIPASITSGVPHAVRTLNFAWTWELFIACGIVGFMLLISKYNRGIVGIPVKIGVLTLTILSIINIFYYLNQYFVQLNFYTARDWLYGYKQVVAYVDSVRGNYDTIIVENEVPFDQSYMFYLFYLKVDPKYYQSMGGTNSGGFAEQHKGFYNITFEPVSKAKVQGKTLFVGKPGDLSSKKIKKMIYYPDGSEAITVAE